MSHPFEGWSAIGEGWDAGDISVENMIENLKTVASNFLGPVAMFLAGLWGLKVAVSFLVGVLQIGAQVAGVETLYTVAGIVGFLSIPAAIIVGLLQNALYRPIQLQAFEGKAFVGSIGEVFTLAKEVVGKTAIASLLYGLTVAVGALFCVVGALVPLFFFCQAPYLAATTELSAWESMRRSYELNKAYYMPVLLALAVSLVVGGGVAGCGGAILGFIGHAITGASPGAGSLVSGLGSDLVGILCGSIVLIVSGGLFTTIQSVERGVPFRR